MYMITNHTQKYFINNSIKNILFNLHALLAAVCFRRNLAAGGGGESVAVLILAFDVKAYICRFYALLPAGLPAQESRSDSVPGKRSAAEVGCWSATDPAAEACFRN